MGAALHDHDDGVFMNTVGQASAAILIGPAGRCAVDLHRKTGSQHPIGGAGDLVILRKVRRRRTPGPLEEGKVIVADDHAGEAVHRRRVIDNLIGRIVG